jgi:hypothetical protein
VQEEGGNQMMYLLIGWRDGFGNDAYVKSVYPTREEAIKHADTSFGTPDRLIAFNFGEEIDFDYYSAEPIRNKPHGKKTKKKT